MKNKETYSNQKDKFLHKYLTERPVLDGMVVEEVKPNVFCNEYGVTAIYNSDDDRFYQEGVDGYPIVDDYPMTAFQVRQFFRETF